MTDTLTSFPSVEVTPEEPRQIDVTVINGENVIDVVLEQPAVIDVSSMGSQGPRGNPGPETVWFDFSRRGPVIGPYLSPLRKYVDRLATLDRIIIGVATPPDGGPLTVDFLRTGVSLFPGGGSKPRVAEGHSYVSLVTSKIFSPGDYLQVSVLGGVAADLTISAHLTYQ